MEKTHHSSTLAPLKDFRAYRRKLPHLEQPGSLYFVTFNTSEGFTLCPEAKDTVVDVVKFHSDKKYKLHALVVMDTHLLLVLQPL